MGLNEVEGFFAECNASTDLRRRSPVGELNCLSANKPNGKCEVIVFWHEASSIKSAWSVPRYPRRLDCGQCTKAILNRKLAQRQQRSRRRLHVLLTHQAFADEDGLGVGVSDAGDVVGGEDAAFGDQQGLDRAEHGQALGGV